MYRIDIIYIYIYRYDIYICNMFSNIGVYYIPVDAGCWLGQLMLVQHHSSDENARDNFNLYPTMAS